MKKRKKARKAQGAYRCKQSVERLAERRERFRLWTAVIEALAKVGPLFERAYHFMREHSSTIKCAIKCILNFFGFGIDD